MDRIRAAGLTVLMTAVMAQGMRPAPAAAAGFTDYDIALQELDTVKKTQTKKNSRPAKSKKARKSQSETRSDSTRAATGIPDVPAGVQPVASSATSSAAVTVPETRPPAAQPPSTTSSTAAAVSPAAVTNGEAVRSKLEVSITHEPYSFIVAGKRTFIAAVVSGPGTVRSVSCRFRVVEGKGSALAPMMLMPNSRYTYGAILPAVADTAQRLAYSFVVTDVQGGEQRSPEYVVEVKGSPIVPGWQLEKLDGILKLAADGGGGLEGFQDPGLARKQ